jgi:AraC-like DNA-binding protein
MREGTSMMNALNTLPTQPPGDGLSLIRFSSEMRAARERLGAWRDFFGHAVLKVEIESFDDDAFFSDATLRRVPGLGLISGRHRAARYARPRHMVENDDAVLWIFRSGQSRYNVLGRETMVQAGDAVLMGAGEGGCNAAPGECSFVGLRVPKAALAGVPRLEDTICRRIPAETPALQLLTHYVQSLEDTPTLATPLLRQRAVAHVHDLIALSVGAVREAADIAHRRSAGAARLNVIKDYIARNLGENLSVGVLAMRYQVTPRYVQKLFEMEGTTFTAYVLDQRLAHAHRLLADPGPAREKIATIAFDSGFGDISYFNEAFRRRYGATPSDVRAQARRDH